MSELLTGPALDPSERFYVLTLKLEDVDPQHAAELLPLVARTANVVLRQVRGQVTHAEADAHIARANRAVDAVRRTTPAPPNVEERNA